MLISSKILLWHSTYLFQWVFYWLKYFLKLMFWYSIKLHCCISFDDILKSYHCCVIPWFRFPIFYFPEHPLHFRRITGRWLLVSFPYWRKAPELCYLNPSWFSPLFQSLSVRNIVFFLLKYITFIIIQHFVVLTFSVLYLLVSLFSTC